MKNSTFSLVSLASFAALILLNNTQPLQAQINPDGTLGTQVNI